MKDYTVIGIWDETGVVYTEHVNAASPHEAMRIVASGGYPPDQILGALEGSHFLTAACEDSGKAAYVEDLTCKN